MYVKRETNEVADRLVKESPSLMKKLVLVMIVCVIELK